MGDRKIQEKAIMFALVWLFLTPMFLFSQGEFNNWHFGNLAAVNFISGIPVPMTNSGMFAIEATASISDSLGNLLFYSNGTSIYNRNHNPMLNGQGLMGNQGSLQPLFPVKKIDDDSLFYLFTGSWNQTGLYYSIIDMHLDGGLGGVIPSMKNITIPGTGNLIDRIHATRHHNNRDVWLVVRDNLNYASFLITNAGLNTMPVLSPSTIPTLMSVGGSDMKISQDGRKFAGCYHTDEIVEFGLFNSATGFISVLFRFSPDYPSFYNRPVSVEFSSDSKLLYLSEVMPPNPPGLPYLGVFQFDATKTDSAQFMQSQVFLGMDIWNGNNAGGLQLAPDGKIYLSEKTLEYLGVINNPKISGTGCGFQFHAIGLAGKTCLNGLPQFLQKYKVYVHHTGSCQFEKVIFTTDIWPPADSIHWVFGDPASGVFNVSQLLNPTHNFLTPGSHLVTIFVRHNDQRLDTVYHVVNVLASPEPTLGPDKIICLGGITTFNAGACTGCTYLWKDLNSGLIVGATQTLSTGIPSQYEVAITNTDGCVGRDTVQLATTPVPQVTNIPLSKSICSGESTSIALTSGVLGTSFNWTATLTSGFVTGFSSDSGLIINQILINPGADNGLVTYHITPKVGSCVGSTVDYQVTVTPGTPVVVSITASTNNICAGTPVTFTATPTNGGTSPGYQWQVNAINAINANNAVFTYNPASGDQVSCVLTSSNTVCTSNNPAISNIISMIVNPNLLVSVSVLPSANPVCAGTSVTFLATPTNGGSSPVYQWKVNGAIVGTNSLNYTYIPLIGDIVSCILTSNALCETGSPATSIPVTMIVNPTLSVSISVSASSNPFCIGGSVTFTATPINGGATPSYQWQVNAINVNNANNASFTYVPAGGDVVTCQLTSSVTCPTGNPANSNSIIMSGTLAPVVVFASCFDTLTTINAKPYKLKGGLPLGGSYSGPGVNSFTGTFTPYIAGTGLKTIVYTYTNVASCSANKTKTIMVQANPAFTCGNNLTDIRDNKVYPTVQIGTQCWMQTNLDYGVTVSEVTPQTDNCIPEKYDHWSLFTNHSSFYQWNELMKYDDTPAGQGLCPPGWHVPTESEWTTLFDFYSGNSRAGIPLQDPYLNGFIALPQGVRYLNSTWSYVDFATLFWSSTSWNSTKAISHGMNIYNFSVSLYPASRANAFPIRCLHD